PAPAASPPSACWKRRSRGTRATTARRPGWSAIARPTCWPDRPSACRRRCWPTSNRPSSQSWRPAPFDLPFTDAICETSPSFYWGDSFADSVPGSACALVVVAGLARCRHRADVRLHHLRGHLVDLVDLERELQPARRGVPRRPPLHPVGAVPRVAGAAQPVRLVELPLLVPRRQPLQGALLPLLGAGPGA